VNFYKSVIEHRGKLLVRGIHEGKEYKERLTSILRYMLVHKKIQNLKHYKVKRYNQFILVVFQRQENLKKAIIQVVHPCMEWIGININISQTNIQKK